MVALPGSAGQAGDNYITINRYDYGAVFGLAASLGVDNSARFGMLRKLFREFAITGVRIELTPSDREGVTNADGSPIRNMLNNFNVYDDINIQSNWVVPTYNQRYLSETFK